MRPQATVGRIVFMADGSALINAMYDYEGFNEGDLRANQQDHSCKRQPQVGHGLHR